MERMADSDSVVKYQFQADDDDWQAWKNTVPRSKSLEKRILELIEADTEGRVLEDSHEAARVDAQAARGALDDLEAAMERGDEHAARERLQEIRAALEGEDP